MSRGHVPRRFLIIISAAALLEIIIFAAMEFTSRSAFCSSCHEMKPMYAYWQQSRHGKVACLSCHAEIGVLGYVKTKISALEEVYRHFTNSYKRPIAIDSETKAFSQRCLKCHGEISGKGKHHNPIHFQMDMACTTCHRGLVHDRKLNRRLPSYDICNQCHPEGMKKEE